MRYFAGFAESFYYAYTHGAGAFTHVATVADLQGCASRAEDIRSIGLEGRGLWAAPASGPGGLGEGMAGRHPLVRGSGNRHGCDGITRHNWNSPIPPGSFALVSSGVYVSTPEFTFLQLSRVLPPVTMALVGCALCASYRLDVTTGAIARCEPLTSVERMRSFVEVASGVYGKRKASRLLDYVADGAESPQEVNLFLLASLPLDLGGAGMEGLLLNYEVGIGDGEKDLVDRATRTSFRIDMGVPALEAGAEYLGKHHDLQQDEDRARLNALMAMGHRVLQVKYGDICDVTHADKFVKQLGAVLGRQPTVRTPAQELARSALVDELFGADRLQL